MSDSSLARRVERRTRQRAANRGAILDAARRVATREGSHALSLRAVAAEAGYAPASVYEYFRNRAEMVLALAAEDLGQVARSLRESVKVSGALPAAVATLESGAAPSEAERLFTGKLIAALTALSEAAARAPLKTRDDQADVVLLAASVVGLTVFARAGRLKALGFDEQELIARLDRRFTKSD
jgi:AcrR family transcriptional regulator